MLAWVSICTEILYIGSLLTTIIITLTPCRQYEVSLMNLMRRLLGIANHWGEEEPVTLGVTLFNHECNLPPFCPIFVRKAVMDRDGEQSMTLRLIV